MFQVPSYITKITTMRDRSLRLQVDTQELKPDESAKVFDLYDKFGFFLFKDSDIKPEDLDIPDVKPEFKSDKSPSQRLRGVIYRYFEQLDNHNIPFDDFYKKEMEKIIEHYKSKLQ
jgi:hypothetical protein